MMNSVLNVNPRNSGRPCRPKSFGEGHNNCNWIECVSRQNSNQSYFYNLRTNSKTWSRPVADDVDLPFFNPYAVPDQKNEDEEDDGLSPFVSDLDEEFYDEEDECINEDNCPENLIEVGLKIYFDGSRGSRKSRKRRLSYSKDDPEICETLPATEFLEFNIESDDSSKRIRLSDTPLNQSFEESNEESVDDYPEQFSDSSCQCELCFNYNKDSQDASGSNNSSSCTSIASRFSAPRLKPITLEDLVTERPRKFKKRRKRKENPNAERKLTPDKRIYDMYGNRTINYDPIYDFVNPVDPKGFEISRLTDSSCDSPAFAKKTFKNIISRIESPVLSESSSDSCSNFHDFYENVKGVKKCTKDILGGKELCVVLERLDMKKYLAEKEIRRRIIEKETKRRNIEKEAAGKRSCRMRASYAEYSDYDFFTTDDSRDGTYFPENNNLPKELTRSCLINTRPNRFPQSTTDESGSDISEKDEWCIVENLQPTKISLRKIRCGSSTSNSVQMDAPKFPSLGETPRNSAVENSLQKSTQNLTAVAQDFEKDASRTAVVDSGPLKIFLGRVENKAELVEENPVNREKYAGIPVLKFYLSKPEEANRSQERINKDCVQENFQVEAENSPESQKAESLLEIPENVVDDSNSNLEAIYEKVTLEINNEINESLPETMNSFETYRESLTTSDEARLFTEAVASFSNFKKTNLSSPKDVLEKETVSVPVSKKDQEKVTAVNKIMELMTDFEKFSIEGNSDEMYNYNFPPPRDIFNLSATFDENAAEESLAAISQEESFEEVSEKSVLDHFSDFEKLNVQEKSVEKVSEGLIDMEESAFYQENNLENNLEESMNNGNEVLMKLNSSHNLEEIQKENSQFFKTSLSQNFEEFSQNINGNSIDELSEFIQIKVPVWSTLEGLLPDFKQTVTQVEFLPEDLGNPIFHSINIFQETRSEDLNQNPDLVSFEERDIYQEQKTFDEEKVQAEGPRKEQEIISESSGKLFVLSQNRFSENMTEKENNLAEDLTCCDFDEFLPNVKENSREHSQEILKESYVLLENLENSQGLVSLKISEKENLESSGTSCFGNLSVKSTELSEEISVEALKEKENSTKFLEKESSLKETSEVISDSGFTTISPVENLETSAEFDGEKIFKEVQEFHVRKNFSSTEKLDLDDGSSTDFDEGDIQNSYLQKTASEIGSQFVKQKQMKKRKTSNCKNYEYLSSDDEMSRLNSKKGPYSSTISAKKDTSAKGELPKLNSPKNRITNSNSPEKLDKILRESLKDSSNLRENISSVEKLENFAKNKKPRPSSPKILQLDSSSMEKSENSTKNEMLTLSSSNSVTFLEKMEIVEDDMSKISSSRVPKSSAEKLETFDEGAMSNFSCLRILGTETNSAEKVEEKIPKLDFPKSLSTNKISVEKFNTSVEYEIPNLNCLKDLRTSTSLTGKLESSTEGEMPNLNSSKYLETSTSSTRKLESSTVGEMPNLNSSRNLEISTSSVEKLKSSSKKEAPKISSPKSLSSSKSSTIKLESSVKEQILSFSSSKTCNASTILMEKLDTSVEFEIPNSNSLEYLKTSSTSTEKLESSTEDEMPKLSSPEFSTFSTSSEYKLETYIECEVASSNSSKYLRTSTSSTEKVETSAEGEMSSLNSTKYLEISTSLTRKLESSTEGEMANLNSSKYFESSTSSVEKLESSDKKEISKISSPKTFSACKSPAKKLESPVEEETSTQNSPKSYKTSTTLLENLETSVEYEKPNLNSLKNLRIKEKLESSAEGEMPKLSSPEFRRLSTSSEYKLETFIECEVTCSNSAKYLTTSSSSTEKVETSAEGEMSSFNSSKYETSTSSTEKVEISAEGEMTSLNSSKYLETSSISTEKVKIAKLSSSNILESRTSSVEKLETSSKDEMPKLSSLKSPNTNETLEVKLETYVKTEVPALNSLKCCETSTSSTDKLKSSVESEILTVSSPKLNGFSTSSQDKLKTFIECEVPNLQSSKYLETSTSSVGNLDTSVKAKMTNLSSPNVPETNTISEVKLETNVKVEIPKTFSPNSLVISISSTEKIETSSNDSYDSLSTDSEEGEIQELYPQNRDLQISETSFPSVKRKQRKKKKALNFENSKCSTSSEDEMSKLNSFKIRAKNSDNDEMQKLNSLKNLSFSTSSTEEVDTSTKDFADSSDENETSKKGSPKIHEASSSSTDNLENFAKDPDGCLLTDCKGGSFRIRILEYGTQNSHLQDKDSQNPEISFQTIKRNQKRRRTSNFENRKSPTSSEDGMPRLSFQKIYKDSKSLVDKLESFSEKEMPELSSPKSTRVTLKEKMEGFDKEENPKLKPPKRRSSSTSPIKKFQAFDKDKMPKLNLLGKRRASTGSAKILKISTEDRMPKLNNPITRRSLRKLETFTQDEMPRLSPQKIRTEKLETCSRSNSSTVFEEDITEERDLQVVQKEENLKVNSEEEQLSYQNIVTSSSVHFSPTLTVDAVRWLETSFVPSVVKSPKLTTENVRCLETSFLSSSVGDYHMALEDQSLVVEEEEEPIDQNLPNCSPFSSTVANSSEQNYSDEEMINFPRNRSCSVSSDFSCDTSLCSEPSLD